VGLSAFTVRFLYNETLLRRITGTATPPATFEEFVKVCGEIGEYGAKQSPPIQAVASSAYSATQFEAYLLPSLVGNLSFDLDFSRDGSLTIQEKIFGYLNGDYSFAKSQDLRLAHELFRELARHFAPGFMATQRDESLRQFKQQRAVFFVSGSWDVPSLSHDSAFPISVMGFPLPDASSPTCGPFYDGAYSEAETQTGFGFSIAQSSKHPELALDLLRYLTSLKANEALNRDIQWIPVIQGAEATDLLKGFVPRVEGTINPELFNLLDGGRFFLLRSQLFWPYISGQSTYD
jgi:ABC-type glycerol-3-phosphate transport system substrate-binding protein